MVITSLPDMFHLAGATGASDRDKEDRDRNTTGNTPDHVRFRVLSDVAGTEGTVLRAARDAVITNRTGSCARDLGVTDRCRLLDDRDARLNARPANLVECPMDVLAWPD